MAEKDVLKAAETHPNKAKETNPVAEATGAQSKDPYAMGEKIANPEPNNGLANAPTEADAKKAAKASAKKTADTVQGDKVADAKADKAAKAKA